MRFASSEALAHFAELASGLGRADLSALPGAGAAGGCGFGSLSPAPGCCPGAAAVCDLVGLDAALGRATVAITGEGRLDSRPHRQGARRGRDASDGPRDPVRGDRRTVIDPLPQLFSVALALDAIDGHLDPMRHARALLRRAGETGDRKGFHSRDRSDRGKPRF